MTIDAETYRRGPIPGRIRHYRLKAGLTQQNVADSLSGRAKGKGKTSKAKAKHKITIERWESGRTRNPAWEDLEQLAKLYGCRVEDFYAQPASEDEGASA